MKPYEQLRFALGYAAGAETTEVGCNELRALLDERAQLRARIHQLQHEADLRCAPIESERDRLRGLMSWAHQELNRGRIPRTYWSQLDTACAAVLVEERDAALAALAEVGKYLQMIGDDSGAVV